MRTARGRPKPSTQATPGVPAARKGTILSRFPASPSSTQSKTAALESSRFEGESVWNSPDLFVWLRLAKTDDFVAILELTALPEDFDTFKTFQDVALGRDGAGSFETTMLGHKFGEVPVAKSREL